MSKRILLIEDDRGCEMILSSAIKGVAADAEVDVEESAEEAFRNLEKGLARTGRNYDLIVVDVFLAGKATGLDFWEKYSDKYPDTPFLFVSSLPVQRFFESIGKNTIAPAFLPKPFRAGEARQLIQGLLSYH